MASDQNKNSSPDFPPIDWQALVALSPENGRTLTTTQVNKLAGDISSSNHISSLEIEPDNVTDNVICTFGLQAVSKAEAVLHCVEAIFDGTHKAHLDLGFVAMQLAESVEIEIDGSEILTNSEHDVSTEADDLFKQLLELDEALSSF